MASSAEVRLMLNAVDNSSKVIAGVTDKMGGMQKATKAAGDLTAGLGISFDQLANPAMLAGKMVGAFADYTKQAVNETVDYTKEIRDLAQNLNITTEETSRLIQTADDYGVSQDKVTAAMEMALKNGFAPTIDSLAKAADQYLAIQDPTERAAALTKIYGRNWAELTPMLKEGGQAIRDAAAAQADNLLVTEEAAQAARDYEIAMDGLGDTMQGFKYQLGNAVLPALTDTIEKFNEYYGAAERTHQGVQVGPDYLRRLCACVGSTANVPGGSQPGIEKLRGASHRHRRCGEIARWCVDR